MIEGASGSQIRWADVWEQACRWTEQGIAGPVGLALADPVAMAANFLAALAAGVLVVPLDPFAPAPELEARIDQFALAALITDRSTAAPIQTWSAGPGHLDRLGGPARGGRVLPAEPGQVSILMASSGTSWSPKIVPLAEQQLLTTAAGVAEHLRLGPGERGYSPLPLFHINGLVVGVLAALVADASIVLERQFSRRSFWATVEAREVTWLNLVPAMLAILPGTSPGSSPSDARHRIRLARSASAPLPAAVRRRFESRTGIPVIETYGMTEAASQITANPLDKVCPGSVGQPVDIEARVLGPDGRPAASGERGDVQLKGERVTRVYWVPDGPSNWVSKPAKNSNGWLPTGDVGWLDDHGCLYLVGRQGDVINRGGEKLQPREVEDILLADPRVTAAIVVGRPHPTVGEEPVAYVFVSEDTDDLEQLADDLDDRCRRYLSRYKWPALIYPTRTLPAGPTGKIRRAEVKAMVKATAFTITDPVSPIKPQK